MNTLQVQYKSDNQFLLFGCDSHWTISKHSSGNRTEKYVNNLKFHCTTPSNDQSALITYNTNLTINQHFLGSAHTGQSVNTLQEPEHGKYVNIIGKLRKSQNSFLGGGEIWWLYLISLPYSGTVQHGQSINILQVPECKIIVNTLGKIRKTQNFFLGEGDIWWQYLISLPSSGKVQ